MQFESHPRKVCIFTKLQLHQNQLQYGENLLRSYACNLFHAAAMHREQGLLPLLPPIYNALITVSMLPPFPIFFSPTYIVVSSTYLLDHAHPTCHSLSHFLSLPAICIHCFTPFFIPDEGIYIFC